MPGEVPVPLEAIGGAPPTPQPDALRDPRERHLRLVPPLPTGGPEEAVQNRDQYIIDSTGHLVGLPTGASIQSRDPVSTILNELNTSTWSPARPATPRHIRRHGEATQADETLDVNATFLNRLVPGLLPTVEELIPNRPLLLGGTSEVSPSESGPETQGEVVELSPGNATASLSSEKGSSGLSRARLRLIGLIMTAAAACGTAPVAGGSPDASALRPPTTISAEPPGSSTTGAPETTASPATTEPASTTTKKVPPTQASTSSTAEPSTTSSTEKPKLTPLQEALKAAGFDYTRPELLASMELLTLSDGTIVLNSTTDKIRPNPDAMVATDAFFRSVLDNPLFKTPLLDIYGDGNVIPFQLVPFDEPPQGIVTRLAGNDTPPTNTKVTSSTLSFARTVTFDSPFRRITTLRFVKDHLINLNGLLDPKYADPMTTIFQTNHGARVETGQRTGTVKPLVDGVDDNTIFLARDIAWNSLAIAITLKESGVPIDTIVGVLKTGKVSLGLTAEEIATRGIRHASDGTTNYPYWHLTAQQIRALPSLGELFSLAA